MPDARTPEQIEDDIQAQRARLAETVDQLTAKLDVPSRARAKVADVKDRATTADGTPRTEVVVAVGSLAAMALAMAWWRWKHRS